MPAGRRVGDEGGVVEIVEYGIFEMVSKYRRGYSIEAQYHAPRVSVSGYPGRLYLYVLL